MSHRDHCAAELRMTDQEISGAGEGETTVADQISAAAAALDEARRVLETLAAASSGNDNLNDAIAGALDDVEINIGVLRAFAEECA